MTLAAGFECSNGLLLCADTKIVSGIKSTQSKLFTNLYDEGQCATVFAISADDFDLAKAAVRDCEEAIERIRLPQATMISVRNSIESSLTKFYKHHIFPTSPDPKLRVQMDFLVGIWFKGESVLYASQEAKLTPVDGYECIGTGAYLARYLIQQFLGKPRHSGTAAPTMDEVGLIAGFALESVSEYDENVGGEIEYLRLNNDLSEV